MNGNATKGYVSRHSSGGGGGGGTTNYNELSNKPKINGVELSGNKTSEDLHITGGGGASMISYNENVLSSGSSNITYDLGAKLTELGFTGNDVALLSVMPIYSATAPKGCRLYVNSYNQDYNRIDQSDSNCVGFNAVLMPYTITDLAHLYLDINFNSSGNNNAFLSIRIIKAPTT